MNLIFSRASLNACLQQVRDEEWFENFHVPNDGSWDVLAHEIDGAKYVVHRNDDSGSPRIAVMGAGIKSGFDPLPSAARYPGLMRIHRAAIAAAKPPLWLPPDWSAFHDGNLIAFFATTREFGNLRWIVEQVSGSRHDVSFWELTSIDRLVLLKDFHPDQQRLAGVLDGWDEALTTTSAKFLALPRPAAEALADRIDLSEISSAAVTKHRTYSAWLEQLSEAQSRFVNDESRRSIKVRGPAGSGKTLALEIKALRELYSARDAGRPIRILFATHSWAVAIQVDEAIRSLDESGDISEIEIIPLLSIAQSTLPRERALAEFRLLGEDSLSGKQQQLDLIATLLDDLREADWLAYRDRASAQFRSRMESSDEAERRALVWDLMNEFASVLSANGILPGVNAERRYAAIGRSAWMMPLDPDSIDRTFVLYVYDRYVAQLKAVSAMSSDQLINDFLNYLETFTWNIKREAEGYDVIFADELHLFSQQERLALNLLTRSASQYPRMYMALDPRQSPSEVYAGFSKTEERSDNVEADLELGQFQSVELKKIYRFTPQILELLRHLNRSYPAVDNVGEDWVLDLDSAESAVAGGPKPNVVVHKDLPAEMASVVEQARTALTSADGKVAVIVLDPLLLPRYHKALLASGVQSVLVSSRDDVEQLRYVKRGVVLSAAEYVAGLQFNTVICGGFVDTSTSTAHFGHSRRRLLSLMYLAFSRATFRVVINVNDSIGGVPQLLDTAFSADIVVMVKEKDIV